MVGFNFLIKETETSERRSGLTFDFKRRDFSHPARLTRGMTRRAQAMAVLSPPGKDALRPGSVFSENVRTVFGEVLLMSKGF